MDNELYVLCVTFFSTWFVYRNMYSIVEIYSHYLSTFVQTDKSNFRNRMLKKATSLTSIIECMKRSTRCKKKCLLDFNISYIQECRYSLWTKTYTQRVEWFSEQYRNAELVNGKPYFTIQREKSACGKCFISIFNLNKNFYYKWLAKCEEGAISSGYRKCRSQSKTMEEAMMWLEDYAKYRGDFMPDRQVIMLPYKTRKHDIYKYYVDEMNEKFLPSIAQATFYAMWSEHFKDVKIKKVV